MIVSTPAVTGAAAAFLGALVECVEAATIVLAIGMVRGWRSTLAGAAGAAMLLTAVTLAAGPLLLTLPAAPLRILVGLLSLLFGLRWLRKAVRRAAGLIPLRDEQASFDRTRARMGGQHGPGWDAPAAAAAFQIVMLEGMEVVFIVAAIGAGGGSTLPASLGALAAVLLVVALAALLHRPLTRVPENSLKLATGVLLCAFGTFWVGEGAAGAWIWGNATLLVLMLLWAAAAFLCVRLCRRAAPA
jgi:uncharacterized membrane protein